MEKTLGGFGPPSTGFMKNPCINIYTLDLPPTQDAIVANEVLG